MITFTDGFSKLKLYFTLSQLKLSDCNDNDDICKLIKECWSQRPNLRPTFGKIAQILDGWAMPGQSFGDFIASQMEEYSYGLDQKVKGLSIFWVLVGRILILN